MMKPKLSPYQQYIQKSRYARWLEEENRRENWDETVHRYIKFFTPRLPESDRGLAEDLEKAIYNLELMPSMRAMMTAGPALEKDNCAGYNCSYIQVDDPRAFDEAMYISMCFHPDTPIRVKGGVKPICQIEPGDWVLSKDEVGFFYQPVAEVVENPTENREKLELEFSDGSRIRCSEEHEFLTQRGYVAAKDLTLEDNIVEESFCVYLVTNQVNQKIYVGYTGQTLEKRFVWHCNDARSGSQVAFHRAIRKYGAAAFKVEKLETSLSLETAKEREKYWVQELRALGPQGYNCTVGGEGASGYRWTEEQKKNKPKPTFSEEFLAGRSLWMKEYNSLRIFTPEYREHLSKVQTGEKNHNYGKPMPETNQELLRDLNSGNGNPFFGKHHTEAAKEANSTAHQGKQLGSDNPSARPVVIQGRKFDCMKQAIVELRISYGKLYGMLNSGEAQYADR